MTEVTIVPVTRGGDCDVLDRGGEMVGKTTVRPSISRPGYVSFPIPPGVRFIRVPADWVQALKQTNC